MGTDIILHKGIHRFFNRRVNEINLRFIILFQHFFKIIREYLATDLQGFISGIVIDLYHAYMKRMPRIITGNRKLKLAYLQRARSITEKNNRKKGYG